LVNELTENHLSQSINYTNTKEETFEHNLANVLLHLFNHQTHHRGQITTLLSQIDVDYGTTDFIRYITA